MNFLDLFKAVLLTLFSYVVFRKVIKHEKRHILFVCVCIVVPALLLFFLSQTVVEPLNSVFVIVILSVFISFVDKSEFKSVFFYLGISYAVSHILYLVSVFITSVLFVTIFNMREINIQFMIMHLAIEIVLLLIIRKVRKFKITIEYNKNIASAGTAIAGIVLIIYSFFRMGEIGTIEFIYLFSGIILCGLGIYWWLKKESVNTFNIKAQEQKNSEQQAEIEQLNAEYLELEKARHTDNKKLPAYREMLEQAIAGDSEAKRKALNFFITVQSRVNCETGSIQTFSKPRVDAIIYYSHMRCEKCGIRFESVVSSVTAVISELQLETLIANLLDNAITSHENNGNQEKYIAVHLWEEGLSVKDNGEPFRESVLADMTRCKETLTPNRGNGVGIGYVTIFEITNECGASVQITQNDKEKSVTVRFDSENLLVIANEGCQEAVKFYVE